MVEAEDLRAVRERARGREWREGPAEMAVIGEGGRRGKRQAMELTR